MSVAAESVPIPVDASAETEANVATSASGDVTMIDADAQAVDALLGGSTEPAPLVSVPPVVTAPPAPVEQAIPAEACETLYIQNLNESVKIDVIKQTLRNLFKHYGPVLDVVAHRNIRMRGQAFVSFADKETAFKAFKEVKGFPLYAKPMQVSFAKTRSDAVISKLTPAELEAYKTSRVGHKKKARWHNPHKRKEREKHRAAVQNEGTAAAPVAKRPAVQMPDEYLPPNKILFLQNLPETTTKQELMELFSQHPNLVEVRMIPTKKDIAFVEYENEQSSGVAKDALHNYKLDGEHKLKITFARK